MKLKLVTDPQTFIKMRVSMLSKCSDGMYNHDLDRVTTSSAAAAGSKEDIRAQLSRLTNTQLGM